MVAPTLTTIRKELINDTVEADRHADTVKEDKRKRRKREKKIEYRIKMARC